MSEAKETECLFNKCNCGNVVVLKEAVWLNEAEELCGIFTEAAKRTQKSILTPKHKARQFSIGFCKCGNVFYRKQHE